MYIYIYFTALILLLKKWAVQHTQPTLGSKCIILFKTFTLHRRTSPMQNRSLNVECWWIFYTGLREDFLNLTNLTLYRCNSKIAPIKIIHTSFRMYQKLKIFNCGSDISDIVSIYLHKIIINLTFNLTGMQFKSIRSTSN